MDFWGIETGNTEHPKSSGLDRKEYGCLLIFETSLPFFAQNPRSYMNFYGLVPKFANLFFLKVPIEIFAFRHVPLRHAEQIEI